MTMGNVSGRETLKRATGRRCAAIPARGVVQ